VRRSCDADGMGAYLRVGALKVPCVTTFGSVTSVLTSATSL